MGTGTGFLSPQNWRNFGSSISNLTFNDVNADGRADALVLTGGRFRVYLSTGSGFDETERYWGTGLGSSVSNLSFGDFNADGRIDIFRRSGSTGYIHATDPVAMTDRLTTLTNGYGSQIKFNYGLTNDPAVHEADNNSAFPRYDINAPMRVVTSTDVSDGIGGWHNTRYKYYGAKGDRHGRGFLGFRQIQTYEDIHLDGSESVTTTIYSQSYPHTGSVLSSETRVDNTKVSESTNTYAMHSSNAGIEYPYLQSNTTHTWDIDASNSLVDSKTTTNVYDDYGNPTRIIISTTGDGKTHTVTTDNNYYPANISQWHLDRLQQTTVTSSDASSAIPSVVRVSDFQYNTNGLLSMERIEPNAGNALTLTTDYVYDSFGNITSQTVSGWNGSTNETRTTRTTYSDGTFPNTITNAIGQSETRVYDSALGVMLSQIGPNRLPTRWQYDSFGRRLLETRPDGSSTQWQYGDCNDTAVQYCASFVTTTTAGAAPGTVYSDNLGRLATK
ncbi:MAG TPA: hypothetical protein EYP31_02660 [Roseibacterium sp.]|nr:hypothetical protein [Roseibacterium sp.]